MFALTSSPGDCHGCDLTLPSDRFHFQRSLRRDYGAWRRSFDGTAKLSLADAKGKKRVVIEVSAEGRTKFSVLEFADFLADVERWRIKNANRDA